MTNRRSLKRLLLFALGIALPLTAGCHSVNDVNTPSTLMAHMKTIYLDEPKCRCQRMRQSP